MLTSFHDANYLTSEPKYWYFSVIK
jgi:hypothetical protein